MEVEETVDYAVEVELNPRSPGSPVGLCCSPYAERCGRISH